MKPTLVPSSLSLVESWPKVHWSAHLWAMASSSVLHTCTQRVQSKKLVLSTEKCSHHLPNVCCPRLGRVDATRLLPLGHAPPELVVLVQDGDLGSRAQLPELSLGGAVRGGALAW